MVATPPTDATEQVRKMLLKSALDGYREGYEDGVQAGMTQIGDRYQALVDQYQENQMGMIEIVNDLQAQIHLLKPKGQFDEDAITRGRTFATEIVMHGFASEFLPELIAESATRQPSDFIKPPNPMTYTYDQTLYGTFFLGMLSAEILRETCVTTEQARGVLVKAMDKVDEHIITTEDLPDEMMNVDKLGSSVMATLNEDLEDDSA